MRRYIVQGRKIASDGTLELFSVWSIVRALSPEDAVMRIAETYRRHYPESVVERAKQELVAREAPEHLQIGSE